MKYRLLTLLLVFALLASCAAAEQNETAAAESGELFPASFDLRDVDGKCYVTPVRSQAPFGTCWSFATAAALESSILGAGLNGADGLPAAPGTLNLSEKQLAWFSAMPLREEGNPQNGEGQFIADFMTEDGLVTFMNRGGNEVFSASSLFQGIGPAHESLNPCLEYRGQGAVVDHRWVNGELREYSYSLRDDWAIPDEYRFLRSYDVREARFLPVPALRDEEGHYKYNEEATKAIKRELMQLRAVQINFCADTSMPGQESDAMFLSENWAHYTYIPTASNHAVTIVGWDDNYSRDNFLQGSVEAVLTDGSTVTVDKAPPADGAWLVKNSWGAGEAGFPDEGSGTWGIVDENGLHTGYFWLSYYDMTIGAPVSYVVEEAREGVNLVNQHDYMQLGDLPSYYSTGEAKMANVFWPDHSEVIEQVSCFTPCPDTTVTYDICLICEEYIHPAQGLKVATKTVRYPYGGYHREDVSSFDILIDTSGNGTGELLIPKWQGYAIVVTETVPDGRYAVNYPNGSYTDGGGLSSFKGIINETESWIFLDGEWHDYSYAEDIQHNLARAVYPELYEDEYAQLNCDNFPIKAYCRQMENDCMLEAGGATFLYYNTQSKGASWLRVGIHAERGTLPDIGPEDLTWGVDGRAEGTITLETDSENARAKITALDAEDGECTVYCTVKGIGTVPMHAAVSKIIIRNVLFPSDPLTGRYVMVYEYTGRAIEPAVGVDNDIQQLTEGVDYEFVYSDNVKCGLAHVTVKTLSDIVSPDSYASDVFLIVPGKPAIESAQAAGNAVNVKLADQSASGLSGYRVEYRAQGEEAWKEKTLKAPETELVIGGLKADTVYELRASGYVEPEYDTWFCEGIAFGETCEIVTVKTGAAEN